MHALRPLSLGLIVLCSLAPKAISAAETLPLAGEWRFALDRADAGVGEKWFATDLPDKIQLPGILQAQGYGDDIRTNTPWVTSLGDAWWQIQPARLRESFSQPGRVMVPFLSQPPQHYLGAAWYQRDIQIPTRWTDRRVTLFLERAHWQSTVWVDDRKFPANNGLGTPHITDLGTLTPGKHRLSIRVDNRTQLPAAGHLVDSHSISDGLGAAWNGIVGKIELRATPPVWIDNVQVFPNVQKKSIHARMTLHNSSGIEASGKVEFYIESCSGTKPIEVIPSSENFNHWSDTNASIEADIDLGNQAEVWNEFSPALYRLRVEAGGGTDKFYFDDSTTNIFALREITANDKDLLINSRPINLRLTHDGGCFPLTGYPAMEVGPWKKIIQACKDYGLNGIRFHSWCPPDAAFEAADELGFYLQPECGLWADFGNPETRQWLNEETARMLAAYGNHPSFILLSPSNEPKNYSRVTPQWAATQYARDNRRLYSAGTGWADPSQVYGGAQFATLVRFGDGQLRNSSGWFGNDYRRALETVHIPVLSHEVGQWCAYPDFDVIKKFTGYLQPGNYEIFKYIAEQEGVLDEDHAFAWASGRFQVACYKEEIEANLRTPGLAGFQLLDLHDYLGQGTALIGVLDAFWESKGYVTPEEFRKFCGPVVPLAWLKKRVFTTDEKLEADIGLAQFGPTELTNALVRWEVQDSQGKVVGQCPSNLAQNIPVGFKGKCLDFSMGLSQLPAPARYKLAAKVESGEQHFENDWNFWLYPAQVEDSKASDVLVTRNWKDAEQKLAVGGKVLFLPTNANLDPAKCPPMKNVPVFWNIQMTVRPPANRTAKFDAMLGLLCDTNHPALAEFPTEANCDWQWTPLVNNVRSVNLETAPRELKPIVWAIDDWNRNWRLGVIFECHVGPGRLMVSAIPLERGGPGRQQLRRSLLNYMGGKQFKPETTLTPEQAAGLWAKQAGAAPSEPARAFDPDLNDGTIPVPAPKSP